jgi:porin
LAQPDYQVSTDDRYEVEVIDYKSSYGGVPQFGGPGSVGGTLREDNEVKKSLIRLKFFDEIFKPWFEFKNNVNKKIGLSFGTDYTAIYQVATESPSENNTAGAIWRVFANWTLIGRESGNTGSLVFKVENRHGLGTSISPQNFGFNLGYIGLTATPYNNFGWGLTNIYWQQRFLEGRLSFIAGIVDVTDYLDIYGLVNPWTQFSNLSFSTGPTIPVPNQGLGAAFGAMLTDNIYIIGGIADANGDPTNPIESFNTFFDNHEYFTHVEIGVTSSKDRIYFDNAHITFWHSDKRVNAGTPSDWGLAFSAAKFINDTWMPFIRGGFSDEGTGVLKGSISTGVGYYFQKTTDLIGLGISWGNPTDSLLDDKYTAELFYRFQLSQNIAITPDIQLLIEPALNPDENFIVVFGIRARIAL